MKSILSLVLPSNPLRDAVKRYLKAGRKAIGFQDYQLVVMSPGGRDQGISCLTADDIQTPITGSSAATMTKRFVSWSGQTAAPVVLNIPVPTSELRELIIQNANTSSATITLTAATATILGLTSATAATTSSVAVGTAARLLSNGTNWYRVQ